MKIIRHAQPARIDPDVISAPAPVTHSLVPRPSRYYNLIVERLSNSVEETEAIAAEFSHRLQGGECIALHGDLGAGKTQFVRGLVRGLGGDPRAVSSPTFVLLQVYPAAKFTIYHLDAYRLTGPDDLDAIGFTEFLGDESAITVIEWPSRILDALPAHRLQVTLAHAGPTQRTIQFSDDDSIESRSL